MEKENLYSKVTKEIVDKRKPLSPETMEAWNIFSKTVFKEGAEGK